MAGLREARLDEGFNKGIYLRAMQKEMKSEAELCGLRWRKTSVLLSSQGGRK
ncbi:hypothetical protein Csa_023090 [Cucumis sativus]|uniref:Uncharacterized protein n=1 Tax=Cucumis sativus TaxID=3659 RepID=A0A0A0KT03_CUCSA|nr:hypothetical protein Csa_023090 [Cucumis sativus]